MRITKNNTRYLVGWGGSPRENWDDYETLAEALVACRELAESDDSLTDEERESLDVWGDCSETGWGVCPESSVGGHDACVVAQYYAYSGWHDWPANPEEEIELVD